MRRSIGLGALGLAAIAVAVVVAGFAFASGTGAVEGSVIDGWRIGSAFTCVDSDPDRRCSALLPVARSRLDERDPGHLPVVASELRNEQVHARTSILYIAVFKLADGSLKAIGVWYPGVSIQPGTLDYGP